MSRVMIIMYFYNILVFLILQMDWLLLFKMIISKFHQFLNKNQNLINFGIQQNLVECKKMIKMKFSLELNKVVNLYQVYI